jgi:hypothetical protein
MGVHRIAIPPLADDPEKIDDALLAYRERVIAAVRR